MSRLKSDLFVSAYLRRCAGAGLAAVLRRRGQKDAGAVFIKLDHLDGTASLIAPAPAGEAMPIGVDRLFTRILSRVAVANVEARIESELKFDSDLWLIEVETRNDASLVDEIAI